MKMQHVVGTATVLVLFTLLGGCSRQQAVAGIAPPAAAPAPAAVVAAPVVPAVCNSCGVVRSVTAVSTDGQASGAGAVIGGIVGGVAGNQVGGGSGRQIATVAGVIGGAVLGNEIEQNRNAASSYNVVIDMEGGGQQVIAMQDVAGISPGSKVRVQGSTVSLR
jgi:outer membrane lipoprotein SlyB